MWKYLVMHTIACTRFDFFQCGIANPAGTLLFTYDRKWKDIVGMIKKTQRVQVV